MRLTVRQRMLQVLNSYGSDYRRPKKSFPSALGEDYEKVWKRFLTTKSAKQVIQTSTNSVESSYYLSQLFLSFLDKTGSLPLNVDPHYKANVLVLKPLVRTTKRIIDEFITKSGQTSKLARIDKRYYSVRPVEVVTHLNAYIGLKVTTTYVYKPSKSKQIDPFISDLKNLMFDEIPVLLQNNTRSVNTLLKSDKAYWYTLKIMKIENNEIILTFKCARAKNRFLFRVEIENPLIIAYGTQKNLIDRTLSDIWKKLN